MPNYVLNRMTGVTEEELRPYISVAEDGTEYLDFKKIIPMPKELDIGSSTDGSLTNKVSLPITNMYKRICTERNKK